MVPTASVPSEAQAEVFETAAPLFMEEDHAVAKHLDSFKFNPNFSSDDDTDNDTDSRSSLSSTASSSNLIWRPHVSGNPYGHIEWKEGLTLTLCPNATKLLLLLRQYKIDFLSHPCIDEALMKASSHLGKASK